MNPRWNADVARLRGEYLFSLGNLCHVPPEQVDRMAYRDFLNLLSGIDQYIEANKPKDG